MNFLDFCRAHGIIIDSLPPVGRWVRLKTTDKPMHRNGAVKFMGTHGHVQNWGTMLEVNAWKNDSDSPIAHQEIQQAANQAHAETLKLNAQAALKAKSILAACRTQKHAYIESKGFADEVVNVYKTEDGPVAVIPMRIGGELVGLQLISEDGTKKFIYGQRSGGAQFVFDNHGQHIFCEGYATALSVRHAMKALKKAYTIHVCFSAINMVKVASRYENGFVIADNDKSLTGERVAREIGFPYWISQTVGFDFNDEHQRLGLFSVSQSLLKSIRRVKV
jgi:putative DNA primase/helicase